MGSILGGSKPSGTQTVTQTSDPWSGIQPQLKQAAADTQKLYENGYLQYNPYPGQTVAPQSGITQLAQGLTAQRALNGSPVTAASQQQVTDTLNGKYLDPQSNSYFQGALNNIADAYARGTGAQTSAAFNRAGAFGGSAMAETQGANNKAFADSLNDLGNQQFQQGRQMQMQAASLAPSIAGQDYTNLSALNSAGAQQDAFNQSNIDANIDRYNATQQAPANAIQNYLGLLNNTGGNYGSQQKATPYYTNSAGNALGLLGGVNSILGGGSGGSGGGLLNTAMAAYNFFSDARLKTNIEHVGYAGELPIYAYSYGDDPAVYEGVMAQDVLRLKPEAIVFDDNGYMRVNYDMLGLEMRKVH